MKIVIPGTVSVQNPAWSPDGKKLSLTDWRGGYNKAPAHVLVYDLQAKKVRVIASGRGVVNCSSPGASWHATGGIIFSSDRWDDDDQVCRWVAGKTERLVHARGFVGTEPSWHPDGVQFCFQQNVIDQEGHSRIRKSRVGSRKLTAFGLPGGDNRQPCWSPDGNSIVYQRLIGKNWWLYLGGFQLIKGTDATWHPDGRVLYSDEDGHLCLIAASGGKPTHIGSHTGYRGAASVSPNGKQVACEASSHDPDDGPGTWLEIFDLNI